jgi:uncharacterized protein with LGFP repeats
MKMNKNILTTLTFILLFITTIQAQVVVRRNLTAINKQKINVQIRDKADQFNLGKTVILNDTVRNSASLGGKYLEFERGVVYFNPKLNQSFACFGKIFEKYKELNWEHGMLGLPISDYTNTPKRSGVYQHFDNGSIYYSKSTGAHFVKGWFKDYWASKGWENSTELGFPTTDEYGIDKDGYQIAQNFEYGSMFVGYNKPLIYTNNATAKLPTADEIAKANPPAVFKKRKTTNTKVSDNFELLFTASELQSK